jgi:hypothetical protein
VVETFSKFPIENITITVYLMVRHKPGTMLLFHFKVPRDQKQSSKICIYTGCSLKVVTNFER